MQDLEEKLEAIGEPDFLDIRVYMTRGWNQVCICVCMILQLRYAFTDIQVQDDAAKIMLSENAEGDSIVRDQQVIKHAQCLPLLYDLSSRFIS